MIYRIMPLDTGTYKPGFTHIGIQEGLNRAQKELGVGFKFVQLFREHGTYYGVFQILQTGEIDAR